MARQLVFDWPPGVSLGPDDFYISEANRQAFAMVGAPESWVDGKLVVHGPLGCGKSHLARVFEARFGATLYAAQTLDTVAPPLGPVIVEDLHLLPAGAEEAMFHLHNHQRNAGQPLLMTAQVPPARLNITLPDLASRMQATTPVGIDDPDDALLTVLIIKLFADRQLSPPPALASYLALRIERSFAAASDIVARLDVLALQEGKPITRAMAARLLDNAGPAG